MQRPDLYTISDQHLGIITVMGDNHMGWGLNRAHHHFCVHHLTSNFYARLTDKSLKMILVRAAYGRRSRKFDYQMERIVRISQDTPRWLMSIPPKKLASCHDL